MWTVRAMVVETLGNAYVAGGRTYNLSLDPLRLSLATEAMCRATH